MIPENVAHLSLFLHLIADDVFDRASVELRDLLKFIEADSHPNAFLLSSPGSAKTSGAIGARSNSAPFPKRDVHLSRAEVVMDVRFDLPAELGDPILDAVPGASRTQYLLRKFLKKLGVAPGKLDEATGVLDQLVRLYEGELLCIERLRRIWGEEKFSCTCAESPAYRLITTETAAV